MYFFGLFGKNNIKNRLGDVALVIFQQVFILFVFVAIGYLLCKRKLVSFENSKILSALLVYVFLPFSTFKTFANNFTAEYISKKYYLIIISLIFVFTISFLGNLLGKVITKDKYERNIYEYSLVVSNYAYMGYPLAESLLGQDGLMNVMIFAIPVTVYIYTVGFARLTKSNMKLKNLLFSPVLIAIVLGAIVGLAEISVHGTVTTILNNASNCMGPVGMLLMGTVIAEFDFKSIIKNKNIYIVTFLRLIVIPAVTGGILSISGNREIVQTAVMFSALPCGLNTVIFPKLVDENCKPGAGLAVVSNLLGCITIPVMLSLFGGGI